MFASEGDSVNVGRQGSAVWADRWDDTPRPPSSDEAAAGVARRLQARLDRHLWLLERLRAEQSYPEPPGFAELAESGHRMRRDTESLLVLGGQEPGVRGGAPRRLPDILAEAADAAEEPRPRRRPACSCRHGGARCGNRVPPRPVRARRRRHLRLPGGAPRRREPCGRARDRRRRIGRRRSAPRSRRHERRRGRRHRRADRRAVAPRHQPEPPAGRSSAQRPGAGRERALPARRRHARGAAPGPLRPLPSDEERQRARQRPARAG